MEQNFNESLTNLKNFFTELAPVLKQGGDKNEINQKVISEFEKLLTNGMDCSYYLSAISYLQQVDETLKSAAVQKYVIQPKNQSDENLIKVDKDMMSNPSYRALLERCIQIQNEFEEFKIKTDSAVPKLEALNVSLNTMLSDEQNARTELEQKSQKQAENHRKIVDDLRTRITTNEQQLRELQEKYEALESENAALAKSKGRNVDSVYQEMQKVKMELDMKTEKIKVIEEQNRQNLLIYANEVSGLRDQLAQIESQNKGNDNQTQNETKSSKQQQNQNHKETRNLETLESLYQSIFEQLDRKAIETNLLNQLIGDLASEIDHKRAFAAEMIKSLGTETNNENIIEDLKAQKAKLEEEIQNAKKQFEDEKETIQNLSNDLKQEQQELEDLKVNQQKEIEELNTGNDEKETQIQKLKEENDSLRDDIEEAKEKENNLASQLTLSQVLVQEQTNIMQQKNAEIEKLNNELTESKHNHEKLLATNKELSDSISQFTTNNLDLTKQIEESTAEQGKLSAELTGLQAKHEALEKTKAENNAKLEELRNSITEKNTAIESTSSDITKLSTKVTQVNENLEGRIQSIRDVALSMESVCKEHAELMTKLASLSESLQKQLDDKSPFDPVLTTE